MKHFIITRFNLKLWPHDKHRRETQTEEWLNERFRLFETYCLPSLAAQTKKNFIWLVLFDSRTPKRFREKFVEYKRICPQFDAIPIRSEISRDYATVAQYCVSERAMNDRILTTYLDNDDALNKNFVECLQNIAINCKDKTFISFTCGTQYYEKMNITLKLCYRNNHFISLIEDVTDIKNIRTVYGYGSHFYIDRLKNCKIHYVEDTEPMWLETVHRCNVDNDIHMNLPFSIETDVNILNAFGLNIKLSRNSRLIFYTTFRLHQICHIIRRIKFRLFGRDWWK